MHQCVKQEITFSTWCKKSRRERQEEVCCPICLVFFCCSKDREKHEYAEHGKEIAERARQQRQILNKNKPLVCLSCCQVFMSGLFVNGSCNNATDSAATHLKGKGTAHVLITIPEWAVEEYLVQPDLVQHDRKRSWDKANEDVAPVEIIVVPAINEDCVPAEENSFNQKTSILSILNKQRKTDLSEKRGRRVTFSPIAAVAITSRLSIVKIGSQQTGGDSSSDLLPNSSDTPLLSKPLELQSSIGDLRSEDSDAPTSKENGISAFSPSLPSDEPSNKTSADSLFVTNVGDNADDVFSPPLPDKGTNGTPIMTPQMSSTPVTENSERRTASTLESLSGNEESREGAVPGEGIFSSLSNVICCAFQALPSVLIHFFSSITKTDQNGQESGSFGRHRRQRRRSSTFTPYTSLSNSRRRLNQRKGQTLSPLPIGKFLRSPKRSNK